MMHRKLMYISFFYLLLQKKPKVYFIFNEIITFPLNIYFIEVALTYNVLGAQQGDSGQDRIVG